MNDVLFIIVAFIFGIVLGIIFFGGLWFTVKKIVKAKNAALWILGSFIFRMAVVLSGFYFIGAGHWERLLICLVGFVAARLIVIRFTKTADAKDLLLKKKN